MNDYPDWLRAAIDHLSSAPSEMTSEQWAIRIHEALEIVEAKKYATPESRFTFVLSGATEQDIADLRAGLTPFEDLIVEIKRKAE